MQPLTCPRATLFDLDDTLAPSFEPPTADMIARLQQLFTHMPIGIVTGRDLPWMMKDFLPKVTVGADGNFFVISESGAQGHVWAGGAWESLYEQTITEEERDRIHTVIDQAVRETRALDGLPCYGARYVDRKAAVAFSCTGWQTPADVRYTWDPGNKRRSVLREHIASILPEYEVLMGGATTIDVTKKGINKAYGIRILSDLLQIPPAEMLYIGDSLFPGGNDYVVLQTNIQTRSTTGPNETLRIIDELLATCAYSPAGKA